MTTSRRNEYKFNRTTVISDNYEKEYDLQKANMRSYVQKACKYHQIQQKDKYETTRPIWTQRTSKYKLVKDKHNGEDHILSD